MSTIRYPLKHKMPQKSKASPRSSKGVYPAPAGRDWVYLFIGEDEFRKKLSLDRLKARLLGEKIESFNYELYYGKEALAEEIICSLQTIPLTGSRRLVVLKEPELLPEEEKAKLTDYLKHSQRGRTVFVLLSEVLPIPGDEFSTTLSKYAQAVNFERLKSNQISSWIIKEFKLRNKIINSQTARLIRETTQEDLGQIFSLIEQISIYADRRERITDDDVLCFAETPTENSTFKLLDYISGRDTRRSLQVLTNLLVWDSNPSQIIGLIGWHITRLMAIKRMLINRIPKNRIATHFNIGSYTLDRLISQSEDFSVGQLRGYLNTLLDTDLMLKRSNIKGELLLEMLIVKLGEQ